MTVITESLSFMDVCLVKSLSILMEIIIQFMADSIYLMEELQQLTTLDTKYSLTSKSL